MESDFWHERWQKGQIAFHQSDGNPLLSRYWPFAIALANSKLANAGEKSTGTTPDKNAKLPTVFVPLCGKSRDMLWLAESGHDVTGIELSQLAVEAFFAENQLPASIEQEGQLTIYQAKLANGSSLTLYLGNLFDLTQHHTVKCQLIYDRASLIALPPMMRQQYAAHLSHLFARKSPPMLLVTLEYDQAFRKGPPFSVTAEEVKALFPQQTITQLFRENRIAQEPIWQERGLSALFECVYLLD